MATLRTYSDATPSGGNADQGDNRAAREAGNGGAVSPELAALVRMLAALAVDDFLQEESALPTAVSGSLTVAQGESYDQKDKTI